MALTGWFLGAESRWIKADRCGCDRAGRSGHQVTDGWSPCFQRVRQRPSVAPYVYVHSPAIAASEMLTNDLSDRPAVLSQRA